MTLNPEVGHGSRTASFEDFEFYHELFGLDRSFEIFRGNFEELHTAVTVFQEEDADRNRRAENRQIQRQRHIEVHRLLHNFVASAYSLLEHTLRHVDNFYTNSEFVDQYKSKVASDLATAPVRDFIQDLRICLQHIQAVDIWASLKASDQGIESVLELSVSELQAWDGWKHLSRAYMAQAGDRIRLDSVASEYMQLISDFYTWFRQREERIHADLIGRVKQRLAQTRKDA